MAQLRALHQAKGRREQGLLLLEGTHLLQEVLRLGLRPERIVATPGWIERHAQLVRTAPLLVQPVAEAVLAAAATTDSPDGVLTTLATGTLPDAGGGGGFVLALDQLQDPGNLGTLLRTATAAGVDEVWLGGGADPWQPKVLRASAGAALALPLRRQPDRHGLQALLERASASGHQLVATLVEGSAGEAIPYWQLDWTQPTVLLLGNEGAGLHPDLASLAGHRVTIPHSAAVESLNVAVAAGPLLLERWRQQRQRTTGP